MTNRINWEAQLGRRLRLRDLHVFLIVTQRGSMARAAAHLGVSQPAVSEIIANLEHTLGVKLLERGPQGVEPTRYGSALLMRSINAFEELKLGVREIEFMADPTVGELRIGSVETVTSSILPAVLQGFTAMYPRVVLNVDQITTPTLELPQLRNRNFDLVLARHPAVPPGQADLNVEVLFEDHLVLVAGAQSKWARRRKIELDELVDEPWALLPKASHNTRILASAFEERGLQLPTACVVTFSVPLRADLLAEGRFITAFPDSVLRFYTGRHTLKALPVKMPAVSWAVAVATLKNRDMTPVARLFVGYLKKFTGSMGRPGNVGR
jgi:DNA-binding transcriptional LysR family regulator